MTDRSDWNVLLNSVLFSVRCQTHSSMAYSPFHMMYQKDPIMPFQYTGQTQNSELHSDCGTDANINSDVDPVMEMVEHLEAQCKSVFERASSKIVKVQQVYARSYNKKHGGGIKFKVGDKVLWWNKWEDSRKSKLRKSFTGPYEIVSISNDGSNFWLKDKYSHFLKRSVVVNHLVMFYENKYYQVDSQKKIVSKVETDTEPMSTDEESTVVDKCKANLDLSPTYQKTSTNYKQKQTPLTSTPIKSQMVIVSSTEMPLSSDDSEIIHVGTENFVDFTRNPLGDLDVNKIPIKIVDDLHETGDSELTITLQEKSEEPRYLPLNEENCRIVGLKFGLTLNKTDHKLAFVGIGNVLPKPPVVTVSAWADRAWFFHSMSILLSGRDIYSSILWHVLCNYISNPIKYGFLKSYILPIYKSGHEYIVTTNMCNFCSWATEVKIFAFAQISSFDIYVYTSHKNWALYQSDPNYKSERAFYLSNWSSYHFDPVLNVSMSEMSKNSDWKLKTSKHFHATCIHFNNSKK